MSDTKYEIKLHTFNGPLEKLLELIEAKKLEITRLNLAEVTADFLGYLNSLDDINPRVLSDFVAVASRLILIKSHALLPQLKLTEEEEEDIRDLENRLKLYREFKNAETSIKEMWQRKVSFTREYLVQFPEGFYLKQPVYPKDLEKYIERLYGDFEEFFPKTDSAEVRLVSLEEKIEELVLRVDNAVRTSFNKIAGEKEQSEIIVLFLALLHLLKENLITIQQENLFSEIKITKNGGE